MHPPSIEEALQGSSILHDKSFVGGEWVGSNSTFPVCDPATDKVIANVANLTIKDFTTAIEHAHTAFKAFKTTQETARAKMLHAWAALIRQHAKDLGVILTMENGKTLAEAEAEVEYGASFITWFAEEVVRSYGDVIPSRHLQHEYRYSSAYRSLWHYYPVEFSHRYDHAEACTCNCSRVYSSCQAAQ